MAPRILMTGASGFLGGVIQSRKLESLLTIGRSETNSIRCDLSRDVPVLPNGLEHVINCAGKVHNTPKSKEEAEEFFRLIWMVQRTWLRESKGRHLWLSLLFS